MKTPSFFDSVAPIVVTDPLAALLGAAEGGRIEYHCIDVVSRQAGTVVFRQLRFDVAP